MSDEDVTGASTAAARTEAERTFDTTPLPGESFVDGPYLVFTAAYHLRRGYCCNNDCRHCPYR